MIKLARFCLKHNLAFELERDVFKHGVSIRVETLDHSRGCMMDIDAVELMNITNDDYDLEFWIINWVMRNLDIEEEEAC